MIKHNGYYITSTPDIEENAGGRFYQVYSDESCDNEVDNFCLSKEQLADEDKLVRQYVDKLVAEKAHEVDDYEKKERYVGLFGEWADENTSEDRREDIEFEIRELYYELAGTYGNAKPSELYKILSEEIHL